MMDEIILAQIDDLKREIVELKTEVILMRFGTDQIEKMLSDIKKEMLSNDQHTQQNLHVERL